MGAGDGAIFSRHTVAVGPYAVQYLQGGAARELDPVLYLHGLGGAGKWESIHMALGTVALTLLPALPGWQQGAPPEGIGAVRDYAGVVAGFLDALGIGRATVVGHSVGGWIAQYLAVEHPQRVARLVLIDALGVDAPEAPATDLGALDEESFATRTFGKLGLIATAQPYGFGAEWQSVRKGPEFERQWKGRTTLASLVAGRYADPALAPRLAEVNAPALLLWGRLDGIAPVAHGERLRDCIPGSRLRVIEQAGHLPMVEKPETVNRLLRNFLLGIEEVLPGVV